MGLVSILFTNEAVKIKNIGGAGIRTRGCWVGSKNATSVLCSPPPLHLCLRPFFPGSHNDSRMNIALAVTAARQGATIANHVRVKNLLKDENGKICGLLLRDELTGEIKL